MAARSRSPPLAFIAPPASRSFEPSSFAPQQFPLYRLDVGAEPTGAPPSAPPFSSSPNTAHQTLSALHEKYQSLLSHERQAVELERSIWEAERQLYLSKIASLESNLVELHVQLDKCHSGQAATRDFPETQEVTVRVFEDELVDAHNEEAVVLPGAEDAGKSGQAAGIPFTAPELLMPHADSPPIEDFHDEVARADSPGPPEYPYPKTPKSVKGDVEPDEAEIGNLLDQAGRILGKQSYGIHHYDDDDDPEEDFRLILKPNKNFTSSWAF